MRLDVVASILLKMSLHALPAIGSNVTVHIGRVNLHPQHAFVEFGGNFNHRELMKEIYQQMKREIQIHRERGWNFEGDPGDLCLVEEEKTWHRARILARRGNKYSVFLIDDGRTLWVSNSILMWGQSSFFSLPPMTELFIIASVSPLSPASRWSPTACEFLKSLSGKTLCGCVHDVIMPYRIILLEIPSVFKQMHEFEFARKIPIEEFKILVMDYFHEPRDNVSCTTSGSALTNVLTKPAENIEEFHQYLCPELLPGTIEIVEVTQVVDPLNIFCRLHVFSHELKKLSKQIEEYYKNTPLGAMSKPLSDGSPCAAKGSDGKWYRSVLQQNVVFGIAKVFQVDNGIEDFVKVGDIRPLPAKFFRQPVVTYACSLYGVTAKGIGWTANQIDNLKSVLLNQIFVGRFEHLNLSGHVYHVMLYGNKHVNINKSFAVQEECFFMSEDACSGCPFEIQSQETHKDFYNHRHGAPVLSLDSRILSNDSVPLEDVMVLGPAWIQRSTIQASTAAEVDKRQVGNKTDPELDEYLFAIGRVVDVNVSYVESEQKFWCQMADRVSSLKKLMEDVQTHYSCSQFQLPTGSVCVAHHPDDGMWYRAQIIKSYLTPHVDVRLVDYGHRLKVPLQDLRPIHANFLKLKCQALQCILINKLNSVHSESTASDDSGLADSLEFISPTSLCNISLKCTIRAVMYDSLGTVLNIVDIAPPLPPVDTESLSAPLSMCDIEIGAKEKVWITCVKGVNDFYGQLERNAAVVEKLTRDIQQFCAVAQHNMCQVSPQMMCLARYKDGQWYRGQIKSVNPQITVHLVDYGEVLDVPEILPFPAQLSANVCIPFQAVRFRLFNVTLEESFELNSWFESEATDCMFTATVMEKFPSGKLSVELYDGKTNISLKVKEKWHEIKKQQHDTKREAYDIPPKPLWRRDSCNSMFKANQDSRDASKSENQRSSMSEKDGTCTEFAVCSDDVLTSQNAENRMDHDEQIDFHCSKWKDLPLRIMTTGVVSEVYVSHYNSSSSFFVQLASEESDICSLEEKLNCSQLELQVKFSHLLPGDLVKAEYPVDGAWYRAVVKDKHEDGTIHVEFLDYGNEAKLPVLKLRQLNMQFLKVPRYSIHCCLVGDQKREWTKEQIETFKTATVTNGETLLCNFIKLNASVWEVRVEDQGTMLSETLINLESSFKVNTPLSVYSRDVCPGVYKKPEISLGQRIEVYASSIAGPSFFWCQFANSEKLDEISLIAQETGNSSQTNPIHFDHLSPGDPCLGLFPDDNMWYRAQVIKTFGGSASVLFVDYGNVAEIDQTSIKALSTGLLDVPPQSFLCQLEGFKPTDGYWNDDAACRFSALVVDQLLKVVIQNVAMNSDFPNCPQYHVQVECNVGLINDSMTDYWNGSSTEVCRRITDEHFLKPASVSGSDPSMQCLPKITELPLPAIEQNFVTEVYVSHINSPSSFFVQLAKDENSLISLTEELNSTSSTVSDQVQLHSILHGTLVKAVFPEDDSWYRAVIKDTKGKDHVCVEFIDFGNEVTVPALKVCKLDERFLHFPPFGIHCCLKAEGHVREQKGVEQEMCQLKNALDNASEKKLFCKFIKEHKNVWEVKIGNERNSLDGSVEDISLEKWDDSCFSDGQNASPKHKLSKVIEKLTTDTFSLSFKKPEFSVGQTIEAYASSIDGPNYFWCQRANSEELDKITLIAQVIGKSSQTDFIQVDEMGLGEACLALFTDEIWYRAQVIRKSSDIISVLFVDFGNEFETKADAVKPFPVSLLESPIQAFLCQLEGFSLSDGSWNDEATDKFCELVMDKPLKVTIQTIQNDLNSVSPSYHVRVQSQACVVNEQMKDFWSASAAYAFDESNERLNADPEPLLTPGQSAPDESVSAVPDDFLENIKTSDVRSQCASPPRSEDGETLKQNGDLNEELVKRVFKMKEWDTPAANHDTTSGDGSCLTLNRHVSETKKEVSGTDGKCSNKGSHLLPIRKSGTASYCESDKYWVT